MARRQQMRAGSFISFTKPELRFVVPASMKKGALKALADIKELFGPKGEHWTQGAFKETWRAGDLHPMTGEELQNAFNQFCLVGGVREVDGRYETIARIAIALAVTEHTDRTKDVIEDAFDCGQEADEVFDEDTIINFNDASDTDWDDIKAVLKIAKRLIVKAPTK